ncbi:MAG: hypothetical protein ING52_09925 [Burkholderiales bacterium]|nr:hypothetical protein [Burkholderiales bacterium]
MCNDRRDSGRLSDEDRSAFGSLVGAAVARLHSKPFSIAAADCHAHWTVFASVCDNLVAVCRQYRDPGQVDARCGSGALTEQGLGVDVADLRWLTPRAWTTLPRAFTCASDAAAAAAVTPPPPP